MSIISGDGAFAALAKKLHEYGKTVIGCAYEGQINRVLKSVCVSEARRRHRFIPIPAPQAKIEDIPINEVKNQSSLNDDIFVETKKVLQGLKQNIEQLNQLKQVGIPISQIHKVLRDKIPDFDQKREQHGEKLTIFLNKVIEKTDIYLSIKNNKLFLREMLTIGSNGSSNKIVKCLTDSRNNFKEIVASGKS
ncbi:MAG: hypothetical protein V7K55_25365 [Nostoc sp.]|uniref:hypothetical protein n=1 Tax=Nostoc sp. TaxID=1180 RepID=UPI002FF61253